MQGFQIFQEVGGTEEKNQDEMFSAPDLCSRHRDFKHLHHLGVRQWGNCCLFPEKIPRCQKCSWRNLKSQGGGGYFRVCWTPGFPAKWLASSGRIKKISHQNHLQDQKAEYSCSAANVDLLVWSVISLYLWLPPFSHLIFPPCTPQGSLGCSLLLWPDHLSHSAITSKKKKKHNLKLLGLAKFEIKIKSLLISNLSSPYQERNWMQWFENPQKISGIKEFPTCTGWVHFPF